MAEIEQLLERMARKGASQIQIKQIISGIATDITETTCTLQRDDAPPLYNVRLNAIDDDLKSYATIYPKDKTNVLAAIIENMKTEAVVIRCSEVEKIKIKIEEQTLVVDKNGVVFNEGKKNGLVEAQKMTDWMAKVYNDLQTLKTQLSTHIVPASGSAFGLVFTPTTEEPVTKDFENEQIKQ